MNRAEATQIVRNSGWLAHQPEEFQAELIRNCHLRSFEAGEIVYHWGDDAGGIFGLLRGVIELELPNGHVGTIRSPGYWFGEAAAFARAARLATFIVKSDSHFLYLPPDAFERLISKPANCRCFALLTVEHLKEALAVVTTLMEHDPATRICSRLLSMRQLQSGGAGEVHVTQSQLASMCGLTRQTVNKVLKRLVESEVVSSRYGKLFVNDDAKLRALARTGGS